MIQPKIHNILGIEVKCLTWNLFCNQHLNVYDTIEGYYEPDEIEGLNTSEGADIFQLQIYQNTPVGFILITTNSLPEMQEELKKGI